MPINIALYSETATSCGCACECAHAVMKQGDSCYLPVTIKLNDEAINGSTVTMLDEIEYMIGCGAYHKIKAADAWDGIVGKFLLPVLQGDTILMRPGVYDFDCRVKFRGGGVLGMRNREHIHIKNSLSRRVI